MTTYTAIPNADIDQDSPLTQTLLTLNRDNPIAMAEGSDNAPVVAAGWHPYDQVEMGDGADGLIYDFSVDGGTANVEAGTFDDGYEYRMYLDGLEHASGSSVSLIVALYRATDAAWSGNITFSGSSVTTGSRVSGDVIALVPHLVKKVHMANINVAYGTGASLTGDSDSGGVYYATSQKITNMRVGFNGTTITAGKVYLYRRRMDV